MTLVGQWHLQRESSRTLVCLAKYLCGDHVLIDISYGKGTLLYHSFMGYTLV